MPDGVMGTKENPGNGLIANAEAIARSRRKVQAAHPDKGGSPDEFRAAMAELNASMNRGMPGLAPRHANP